MMRLPWYGKTVPHGVLDILRGCNCRCAACYNADRAVVCKTLDQLKAEDNHIVRMWRECRLKVENAGDSQALIQLKKQYCDRKDCLHCRIGFEYMRKPQS